MKTTENPPMRPQRQIVRTNRESAGGLLMSVIRTLSSSRDLADRDRERNELRKNFNECDQRVNELISIHNNDLYQVMNTFSKVLNNLSKSKERLLSTREKLMNCQKLLHCKRKELKQLWSESLENRAQLSILEKVEYVISLPKVIDDAVAQKHYVHASQSCIEGLTMLTDPKDVSYNCRSGGGIVSADTQVPGILSKIEALSEIRSELSKKKDALFEAAIDDLHRHLYQISTTEVRKEFLRLNHSSEDSSRLVLSVEIGSLSNVTLQAGTDSGSGQLRSASMNLTTDSDDPETVNHKTSPEVLIGLTKCLVILNKVPESMEQVRERCERELIMIAIRSAQDILNTFSSGLFAATENRNALLTASKWNILDCSSSSGNSLLNDSSLNSDFAQGNALLGSSGSDKSNSQMAVLSFAPLLGLNYDPYSHLPSMPTSNTNRGIERDPSRRSATMLKNFFTLLMTEFQRILVLHRDVVLPNFKRLENSLYSKMDSDAFYTVDELSAKVQKLVVDLVACVCADTGRSGFPLLGNSLGLGGTNENGLSSATGNSTNGTGTGSTALNGDLSSYFAKRRPLAGAMNAMNAVTKNTMTAVASAAASASNAAGNVGTHNAAESALANSGGSAGLSTIGQSNSNHLTNSGGMVSSSSTHNFLSSVVGGGNQRQNAAPIFKFSQSSQALSWNNYLAEQARKMEKEQEETESDDKAKETELELAKDEQGRIIPGSSGNGTSPSMINKLFDALREIAPPSPDNLVIVFSILSQCNEMQRHSEQMRDAKKHLYECLEEVAGKFAQQVRDQVTRVSELSYKRLQDKSTWRLFPQKSAYFENKLIEEAERSKLSKDESFQLMQQQQQLNSRLYPPLLTSIVIVDITARELESLMLAMPEYREHYLGCICNLFTELKEHLKEVYRKVTTSHARENRNFTTGGSFQVLSTNWCNDQDILRLLKEKPNWKSMIDKQSRCNEYSLEICDKQLSEEKDKTLKLSTAEARRHYNLQAQFSSFDDSPEEIRLRNKGEIELLVQNMAAKKCEKISFAQIFGQEEGQFENLAQLQESAHWMTARCEDVVERIHDSAKDADLPDDVDIATLNHVVTEFCEFSENCLLLIHLEVRFHCFYYLQDLDQNFFCNQAPMLKSDGGGGNDEKLGKGGDRTTSRRYEAMHEDRVINPLLDDLKRINEELEKASLKQHKMHYIFEGLDSLVGTIFVNAVSKANRIKPVGIKRALRAIFNIQKRLMSITKNAESRLDYCRKYFEILLTTPADVLTRIIEVGQEFEASEYQTAIILLHNSKKAEMEALNASQGTSMVSNELWEAELNKNLTQLGELLSKNSLKL